MRRNHVHKALLTLAVLALATACGGENLFEGAAASAGGTSGTVQGAVTATGGPLGAVPIILIGIDSTMTDGQGLYRFEQLPASTYTVAIRVPLNFEPAPGDSTIRTVRLGGGGTETVNFRLQATGVIP
jgi:ABC-type glycerol-3-phosphate transport system substrate-binding protein